MPKKGVRTTLQYHLWPGVETRSGDPKFVERCLILFWIGSAQGCRHLRQEGKPHHQKAQGLDQHHLQKTQDPCPRPYPQVRQKERPEGADLGQVCDHQVPSEHWERHQDHWGQQHIGVHRRQESQQAHDQEGLPGTLQHQGLKSQHPRQTRRSQEGLRRHLCWAGCPRHRQQDRYYVREPQGSKSRSKYPPILRRLHSLADILVLS